ncbi:SMP-30/gluconolactonase/LRE family protein (plasmid) [Rhizobium sp. CB3060]|uniref:SMP-30/gluconolactonase/LRE family protein n=1 Tax=Rhizobium sp. CB3060 TaxID=3138255 RepID=UPI0021A89406|nr:SMP-30/gluconolactonase/LRE family protein [Rhizobium tropici]UWU24270.1 SMP-30/gluconolactonase/LRE family protein [Rhizobium tropici]
MKRLFSGLAIPNSICFSPDGSSGFFADTREGIIYRVPLDPQTGNVIGDHMIFHDSRVIAPSGRLFQSIRMPFTQPSCPAFVGEHAQGMLVTSASINLSADDIQGNSALYSNGFEGVLDPHFAIQDWPV